MYNVQLVIIKPKYLWFRRKLTFFIRCVLISECQNAFKEIIKALTSDLSLAHYDLKQEIYVAADASNLGLGVVLLHKEDNGQLEAEAHASKTSLPREKLLPNRKRTKYKMVFCYTVSVQRYQHPWRKKLDIQESLGWSLLWGVIFTGLTWTKETKTLWNFVDTVQLQQNQHQ